MQRSTEVMEKLVLHPRLSAALDSLDLDLEAEFIRFRQSKTGQPAPINYNSLENSYTQWQAPLDSTVQPVAQLPTEPFENRVDNTLHDEDIGDIALEDSLSEEHSSFNLSYELPTIPPLNLAALLRSSSADQADQTKSLPPSVNPFSRDHTPADEPSTPLESTQKLRNSLDSLVEVELEILRPQQRSTRSWLPKVNRLSIAAALVTGAGLALLTTYLYNPGKLVQSSNPQAVSAQAISAPSVASSLIPSTPVGGVPKAANLAQVEFQNLSQTSLSVLQPYPVAGQGQVKPGQVTTAPLKTTAPPQIAQVPAAQPKTGLMRVVILKADAELLSRVQRVVPDAFLEPSSQGSKIQMGVFSDLSRAEAWVSSLKQQGISADIERL